MASCAPLQTHLQTQTQRFVTEIVADLIQQLAPDCFHSGQTALGMELIIYFLIRGKGNSSHFIMCYMQCMMISSIYK